jgi:hypothetical protein
MRTRDQWTPVERQWNPAVIPPARHRGGQDPWCPPVQRWRTPGTRVDLSTRRPNSLALVAGNSIGTRYAPMLPIEVTRPAAACAGRSPLHWHAQCAGARTGCSASKRRGQGAICSRFLDGSALPVEGTEPAAASKSDWSRDGAL